MDLDHMLKLVQASYEEGERLNTDGPVFAELLAYIDAISPHRKRIAQLEAQLAAADKLDAERVKAWRVLQRRALAAEGAAVRGREALRELAVRDMTIKALEAELAAVRRECDELLVQPYSAARVVEARAIEVRLLARIIEHFDDDGIIELSGAEVCDEIRANFEAASAVPEREK